ncbi:MAG: DUF5343 domain-containing protein [Anaerolineales bacterium]|nr:DUF5343 domain-containing protein [Anaerolineales bacterium]
MSKQLRGKYPSGRPSAIEEVFKLIREEQNWNPSAINVSTLKNLAIAPSKESLTVQSLKFLGILNEAGAPTEVFQKLRYEFQPTLESQIRQAYKTVFDQIPVGRINQESLVKFFVREGYVEDTAEYQGALFAYLCKIAGIDLPNAPASFKRARFKKPKK